MLKRKITDDEVKTQKCVVFEEDVITEALRAGVADTVEQIIQEEVDAALGAGFYKRVKERMGYRHGYEKDATICTSLGSAKFNKPRARLVHEDGTESEWQSQILPRYQRRAKRIDDAILATYLSGVNTRRMKKALGELLAGVPLSKSTISRIVGRLTEHFEKWRMQSLKGKTFMYVYADAIYIKVRMYHRVVRLPILIVIGITPEGDKQLLAIDHRNSESEEAWKAVLQDLVNRGLNSPKLAIIDGSKGLRNAIESMWPGIDVQRCTVHKLKNILTKAPKHAAEEIKKDYNAIVYAKTEMEAQSAYEAFKKKWKELEGVVKSLDEAGPELLTFFKYPETQWKSLRSTNVIERANLEFRRRVKTQGALPNENAALIILFGLYATGQIQMQRINGFKELPKISSETCLTNVK